MRTALDTPPESLDRVQRQFLSTMRQFGWVCTAVEGRGERPPFCYTTGLWSGFGYPELILFALELNLSQAVLKDLVDQLKAREAPPAGDPAALFAHSQRVLLPVAPAHYGDYFEWTRWFYGGDEVPCLHLIWPDSGGAFPWQPGADARSRGLQPDLTAAGWASEAPAAP